MDRDSGSADFGLRTPDFGRYPWEACDAAFGVGEC